MEWRCGTRLYVRSVDRLMLTQPGDLHLDSPLRPRASWQVVRIPRVVVEREAIRRGIAGPIALRTHASADPSAITAFAQLHCAVRRRSPADEIRTLLSRCTGALLDQCHDDGDHEYGVAEHVSVRRARTFMRDSLAGTCSLEELATVGRVGRFHLIKLFRREWGVPPKKYLMHMRVARARTLLSEGVPCTDAAQDTGFCDQSHLNRWFHRVYGMSPGAYVRQRRAALLGESRCFEAALHEPLNERERCIGHLAPATVDRE
jgi:AraC-like DNA-binding protein